MKISSNRNRTPEVSIIIPVYNKCELTIQCFKSIAAVTSHIPHEVIVVDNASTDETQQVLKNFSGKNVRVLRNENNRGFAGACNQGAAAAKGKYLLFLNNDTVALQGWLDELIEEVRVHPEVVAVGSKLLYESGLIQHAGVAFERETRSPFHPYRLLRADDPRANHRRELQAVTAACVLIRPEWFEKCGRFSEEYRNGYEDLDLCLNLRKQGGVIVYQPKSVLYHLESQTPGRMRHDSENRSLFFRKWSDAILSDEDAFYFEDGYRIVSKQDIPGATPKLARFASEEEKARWSVAARVQQLAAAGQYDGMVELLTETKYWPEESAIRKWAGILCKGLQLKAAAQVHFQASVAMQGDPEARFQLGNADSADKSSEKCAWEEPLAKAQKSLLYKNYHAAQSAFEIALLHGAPPALVLPGAWEAARLLGEAAEMEATCQALLALPRLNPWTTQKLHEGLLPASGAGAPVTTGRSAVVGATEPNRSELVSIIILAHNQLELTKRCIASIEQFTPQKFELLLVDNASTDGTSEWMKDYVTKRSNAHLILNATNLGFAAGNNQALALAKGDYVLLLNNDTVVTPDWLENMLAVFSRHASTGIVGPRSNRVAGLQLVENPGYRTPEELPVFAIEWAKRHAGQSRASSRVIGFCLLAKKAVFDVLGGLDEQYGSGNFEDDDYCIRARLAGFEVRIADDSFVHHVGGQTFQAAKIDYRQAMLANWNLFKKKWNIPAEAPMEKGYRMPTVLPETVSLKVALPVIDASHEVSFEGRCWTQKCLTKEAKPAVTSRKVAKTASITLPNCALLGRLAHAEERFKQKDLRGAWEAAKKAIEVRPFHPEAYLLLAEIALSAGDSVTARQCAQHVRGMVPDWKPAKQFLKGNLRGNSKCDWLTPPVAITAGKSTSTPRLSVCLITKNEEKFLKKCLASVRDIATQIVVVDTGSTDRTMQIAREFGAGVHHFTWCDDFGAARNAAIEHARGDWVLILDADEELLPAHKQTIRDEMTAGSVMAYRLPIIDEGREAEGCSYVPRLFRNAPGLFFVGRVHEQIFASLEVRRQSWGLENKLGKSMLLHHGYTKEVVADRNKIERNLRLLELAIEEMPNEPNLLMSLGLELVRSGKLEAGLEKYREAFDAISALPGEQVVPELRETLLSQMCTHLMAAKRFQDIVKLWDTPFAKSASMTASQHFALGLAYMELKQAQEAGQQMKQCLNKRNRPTLSLINPEILKAAPHHCSALCFAVLKQRPDAERAFKMALAEEPKSRLVRFDYARFMAEVGQPVEALKMLHQLVEENAAEAHIWQFGGQIALSNPEFLEFACDWTGEAIKHFPQHPAIKRQRAEALLLSQSSEEALTLWQEVPSPDSSRDLAAMIICEVIEGKCTRSLSTAERAKVGQEFLRWYRQLVAANATSIVSRLNDKLSEIGDVLPEVQKILEAALRDASSAVLS
jgi:GT2 family glycosyltransferase/Tfp pilus assembly protein PilF